MEKKTPNDYYQEIGGLDALQSLYESTNPEVKIEYKIDRRVLRLIRLYLLNYQNTEKWNSMPDGAKEPLENLIVYISKLLESK